MTTGRLRGTLSAAAAAALLAGCATATATPGAKVKASVPDLTAGSACLQALRVVADLEQAMAADDTKPHQLDRVLTRLAKDQAALQSIAAGTTDPTAPEAIQDVADAVSAYIAGVTSSSDRSAEVRATARTALAGFRTVCPLGDGGFEAGTSGWTMTGGRLGRTASARSGLWAGLLTGTGGTAVASPPAVVTRTRTSYDVGLWVRTDGKAITATVQVVELRSGAVVGSSENSIGVTGSWQPVAVRYKVRSPGSSLQLKVSVTGLTAGGTLLMDDLWVLHH
jgi:hypothetical protein